MLLNGYRLEIFKSKCDAGAQGVHCHAHLDDDVREVLPYLNSEMGGFIYTQDPPALTFKNYGKLITIHPRLIAVNALRDNEEAEKIVAWLQREINETWERRAAITPSTKSAEQPKLIEILKLLPRTNCRECGEPTCMVFATRAMDGVRTGDDCPPISAKGRKALNAYLAQFTFQ